MKLTRWASFMSYLAIPLTCSVFAFFGAFGIWPMPDSLVSIFPGDWEIVWAQMWFWSSTSVTIGLVLKQIRNTNLYIWFEYPGLIIFACSAIVYAGALLLRFDVTTSFLAISAFLGIGLRFMFRALELHLVLMNTLRSSDNET